jgi:hypothetical protein
MKKHIHMDDMFYIKMHTAIKSRLDDSLYDRLYFIFLDDKMNCIRRELRRHIANSLVRWHR